MGGAVRGREGRPKEADFEGEIRSVVEETLPMVVECSEAPLEKTRERGLIKVPNVRNIHMFIVTPYLGLLMAKDKADSDSLLAAAS